MDAAEQQRTIGLNTRGLADEVGFELLGKDLGPAVQTSVETALAGGVTFPGGFDPLAVFRAILSNAICDVETHPRGKLFQGFLTKGPYEGDGNIPPELHDQRLSDDETTSVIAFIYAHMVNCFKGAVTELLAAAPCLSILTQLKQSGELHPDAKLYAGDTVLFVGSQGRGFQKGADFHILVEYRASEDEPLLILAGVAEVKSYHQSKARLRTQLENHTVRVKRGMRVEDRMYSSPHVRVGYGSTGVIGITMLPDTWKLSREFHFDQGEHGRLLFTEPTIPPSLTDKIVRTGRDTWEVTLRWSKEALASVAYGMTFWYMEKVGEIIYRRGVPKEWSEMSPGEAGQNAAKMMLYYAILRCRTTREQQRAIALYNSYGFGYALGMSYRDAQSKREMLWARDLDEILDSGWTERGCRIV